MRIRLFNKKLDSDYIISTFEDMYSSNPNFKYTREGFENFKKDINKYENNCDFGLIYVLEDEKRTELVLYMFISFRNGKINNKIIIEKLYIDQEHRNNGYSKLLVNKAKDVAKEKYIKFIELNTFKSNLEFYEKLGFDTVSHWMQIKLD